MDLPTELIADLDDALTATGQDIILRRVTGTESQTNTDVTCRAMVREFAARELVNGLQYGDRQVIISPTQINAASWPLPVLRNDFAVIDEQVWNIEAANHQKIAGTLVRIELVVRG